jgi:hypothetical protein
VHWEDRSTLFYGQSLGLDVHLFVVEGVCIDTCEFRIVHEI